MNDSNLKTIESLFDKAVGLHGEQLEMFLAKNCGDDVQLRGSIVELLGHDRKLESSAFLEQSPTKMPTLETEHESMIGQNLGAFTLQKHIGSGGMGHVYLGVRDDDFKQQAAIKIIRTGVGGEKIARRFRQEMQFLAALGKHPNITSIFDAGTTDDGQLYIAMEYVDGMSINEYCDTHRMGIRRRIELFCRTCEAVQFAHRNAILHRDLKPSNLLITPEGKPMLIDFGVAKLAADEPDSMISKMQTLQHAFTPGYASPEQIENLPATTANDVYSLGVILYELLAGTLPHVLTGKSLAETIRLVCENAPVKPSSAVSRQQYKHDAQASESSGNSTHSLAPRACMRDSKRWQNELFGDLDLIIMKAIDRDVDRRYFTVEQFTDDLKRYLDGKPVKAQPDSLIYRAKKYVRRNSIAVSAATVFLLMLLAGIATTSRLAIVANRAAKAEKEQRILAETREKTANKVVELFDQLIASADPQVTGSHDYPARELIHRFASELKSLSVDDQIVQARLNQTLALALAGIGNYEAAKEEAKKAGSLLEEHLGETHVSTLGAVLLANKLHLRKNNPRSARKWLVEKVTKLDDPARQNDPEFNWVQFESLIVVSDAELALNEIESCETYLKRAQNKIALLESSRVSEANMQLAHRWARLLVQQGKMNEALPFAEQEFVKAKNVYGPSDYQTTKVGDLVAHIYQHKQRYDEAIAIFENNLALSREAYGSQHPITLVRVMHLAIAKYHASDFAEADVLFREYKTVHGELNKYKGPHHHEILIMWADCLHELGKVTEARQFVRQCCEFSHWGGKTEQSKQCDVIRNRLSGSFGIDRETN